jgi:flagellar biosynthesis protein FlhG
VADFRGDQAAGLRRLLQRPPLRVVTFVAGSLGVGKSVTVANLAASLARRGCQVLVVDENTDDGVAAYYGAVAAMICSRLSSGEKSLAEVLLSVAPGVRDSAGSGA